MTIATVGDGWWRTAAETTGQDVTILPAAVDAPANPYTASAAARTAVATRWLESLRATPAEAIVDNGGTGLAFVRSDADPTSITLVHEHVKLPLLSHWIDPLVTVFQGLAWPAVWQCMQSDSWYKFVWDKPQAAELEAFGVPQVHHLPMAAIDREYNTAPLDPKKVKHAISFVGGQNTTYFSPQANTPTQSLLAGTFAHSIRADMPDVCFYDIFYNFLRPTEPPTPDEPLESRINKAQQYFQHKLFYNAMLCIKQRDRFVVFLKHELGDNFALIGHRWDQAYGLKCEPQLPTTDAYLNHFRETAINLNFVNGNSDSGLNMRHYEITAAGGFMLCYHHPELEDQFEIGTECETFESERELLDKIRFYLEHPERRIEIAAAGQRRTLSQHLYSHRLKRMLDVANVAPESASEPDTPNALKGAVCV
jgi:Glycosyl transferases group 1/DUF based on E. rectale Gene description (DUF3880)